jgi:hypothetical protein
MKDQAAEVRPAKEPDSLKRKSVHATEPSNSQVKPAAEIPPNVRGFLDALADLLLDHVLAKRQNPACPDPSPQRDRRSDRSNPPSDRSEGSL